MNKLLCLALKIGGSSLQQELGGLRSFHFSAIVNSSAFVKKQRRIDPEIAKIRENRKRRKLERDIRQLKKHGRTPKPIEELQLDVKSAKTIKERIRPMMEIPEEEIDRRALAVKQYCKTRAALMKKDDAWIRKSIELQDKALRELKNVSPELYNAAVQPEATIDESVVVHGPTLTPPFPKYESPDGDYVDTTRTWT